MSKVAIKGASTGTGTFTIESPATNTDRTLSLPDSNGTILTTATAGVPVNGPAFFGAVSATQSVSAATFTKINFDTSPSWGASANGWDATNKRFRPTVAGYYMLTAQVYCNAGWLDQALLAVYLNGGIDVRSQDSGSKTYNLAANTVVYLNGSTDYLELYVYSGGAVSINASPSLTWIRGAMIRSAT
jgi:hypothetical protein